jgi:hypothetical protein
VLFMTGFTLLPRGPPRRGLLLSFHHRIGVVLGLGLLIGNWVPPVSSLFCHVVQGGDAPSLLSVFEKLHNLKSYLCLGSVGNGLKFCIWVPAAIVHSPIISLKRPSSRPINLKLSYKKGTQKKSGCSYFICFDQLVQVWFLSLLVLEN